MNENPDAGAVLDDVLDQLKQANLTIALLRVALRNTQTGPEASPVPEGGAVAGN